MEMKDTLRFRISGKKHGQQREKIFDSKGMAEEHLNKVKFERGWTNLGMSELKGKIHRMIFRETIDAKTGKLLSDKKIKEEWI